MTWETVIGLEVHAHLSTQTKLFCACSTAFGGEPNAHTCEVCLAMPGALPVLNQKAVEYAVKAAIALGCTIHERSVFARKNYFYPDLPKGYQISQYDKPYATGGGIGNVRLVRIHMEEDAGKSMHEGDGSAIDLNRASVPLIEIVSEPDIRSAEEAAEYLKQLRVILMSIGVCDGNMEEGSLRCDANVSIRKVGEPLGTRVELKNLNSFKFLQQAIKYEVARQQDVLESGKSVTQETRLWDTDAKVSRAMRSKEDAHDYRYFPDPDLPTVRIDPALVDRLRPEVESVLTKVSAAPAELRWDMRLVEMFTALGNGPFLVNIVAPLFAAGTPVSTQQVKRTLELVEQGKISQSNAKTVLQNVAQTQSEPDDVVQTLGLAQVSDESAIEAFVTQVLGGNAETVAKYKAGNEKLFGFLVGQVMKASGGKANPQTVNALLKKHLVS